MSTMLSTQNPERAAELQEQGDQALAERSQSTAAAAAAEIAATGGLAEVAPEIVPEPVSEEGLPQIGDIIHYQPRRGEGRRGRYRVPALVLWRHPGTRLLDLVLIYDANDVGDQQRVPEAVGEERGWLLKPAGEAVLTGDETLRASLDALKDEVSELRAILLGEFDVPERSMLAMLDDMDSRVDGLIADNAAKAIPVVKPPEVSKPRKVTKVKAKKRGK